MHDSIEIADSLDKVLVWAKRQEYVGYSKFDVFNSPFLARVGQSSRILRLALTYLWSRSPINLRPLFFTQPDRNPKGIALFALAYLRRYRINKQPEDLEEAIELLAWLDAHSTPGYSGKCWGYDHDWQSLHYFLPKFHPNIVVTGNVAYAFLEGYETTHNPKYLEIARSVADFMLEDLECPVDTPAMRNIGYIPNSQWAVLNINGLAATILIWLWQHTHESALRQHATRLIAFLADKQTDYGAWHYAWPARTSNVKHDNYHTGNVLDWIFDYTTRSEDMQFLGHYQKGLAFYKEKLFLPNGAPKWTSDRIYPHDTHGAAQGIVTFAKASMEYDSSLLEFSDRIAQWTIANLQTPAGWFIYQKGRFLTKRYTLMRWCNAWMAYALSSLLIADRKVRGEDS